MEIDNLIIEKTFYDIVFYDDDVPYVGESDFHQVKENIILKINNGLFIRFKLYFNGYSTILIDLIDNYEGNNARLNDAWQLYYSQKITVTEWLYVDKDRKGYILNYFNNALELIGILLKFENGRKLRIFSGEPIEESKTEMKILRPSNLLLVVFDSEKYKYLNLPDNW
jgi:hypothetical protein